MSPTRSAFAVLVTMLLVTGCGGSSDDPRSERSAPATNRSTVSTPPAPPPSEAAPPAPRFRADVRRLDADDEAAMTGVTWRPGCPTPLERLRRVTLTHWDFAGKARQGALVVRDDVADDVVRIFRRLFRDGFPIRRMRPIEAYDGDDYTSIEADNTSAFNCRAATGSDRWSHHAYGVAIDVNPLENPYLLDGRTSHAGSRPYLDRDRGRKGMLLAGSRHVRAFTDAGWFWGGEWTNPVDYQHFSARPED